MGMVCFGVSCLGYITSIIKGNVWFTLFNTIYETTLLDESLLTFILSASWIKLNLMSNFNSEPRRVSTLADFAIL